MKTASVLATFLFLSTFPFASAESVKPAEKPMSKVHPDDVRDLKIGDSAPDFDLIGIDDKGGATFFL